MRFSLEENLSESGISKNLSIPTVYKTYDSIYNSNNSISLHITGYLLTNNNYSSNIGFNLLRALLSIIIEGSIGALRPWNHARDVDLQTYATDTAERGFIDFLQPLLGP